jgi:hypothetical protein
MKSPHKVPARPRPTEEEFDDLADLLRESDDIAREFFEKKNEDVCASIRPSLRKQRTKEERDAKP